MSRETILLIAVDIPRLEFRDLKERLEQDLLSARPYLQMLGLDGMLGTCPVLEKVESECQSQFSRWARLDVENMFLDACARGCIVRLPVEWSFLRNVIVKNYDALANRFRECRVCSHALFYPYPVSNREIEDAIGRVRLGGDAAQVIAEISEDANGLYFSNK